jgi:DNA polymerase
MNAPDMGNTLDELSREARACRACPLWENATQTVFGEGAPGARLMLVGEQPGDQEDVSGRPFVGPAGRMLDKALAEAGIDRAAVYVTNAVKHFKFEPRGKRRLHKKPTARELAACLPWLKAEIAAVRPDIVVLLGASAAEAVLGRRVTIQRERGRILEGDGGIRVLVTVHPSFLLRIPDAGDRARAYASFVSDLRTAADAAGTQAAP